MIVAGLLIVPLFAAIVVWLLRGRFMRSILLTAAVCHAGLTISSFCDIPGKVLSCGGITLGFDQCAADKFSPFQNLSGGDVEISAALLAGHRSGTFRHDAFECITAC